MLSLAVLAAVGFGAARWWTGASSAQDLPHSACDLTATPCELALPDGGHLVVSLMPRPPALMKPLQVQVDVVGSSASVSMLEITGLNMPMGVMRAPLQAQDAAHWQGGTILPICSQRRMHWQARLKMQIDGDFYQSDFAFYTQR